MVGGRVRGMWESWRSFAGDNDGGIVMNGGEVGETRVLHQIYGIKRLVSHGNVEWMWEMRN